MTIKIKKNKLIRIALYPLIILRRAVWMRFKNRKIIHYNELFSNVKEGSLVVTLDDIPGTFEIDVRSHLLQRILINKTYEPNITSLIKQHINSERDAIDIGANIGLYANLLSSLINSDRRVLAVEPTPLAFKYLNRNIETNNSKTKVFLYNGVCTDIPGIYTINTIIGKEEYSSIGESEFLSSLNECIIKIQVEGETTDNLVRNLNLEPGLMVIDVEGAEMKVLKGAVEMLAKFKPIIISELVDEFLSKQETTSSKVIEFLENLDYNVQSVNKKNKLKYPFCGNIIAIPKS